MNKLTKCIAACAAFLSASGTETAYSQEAISPFHINAGATFSQGPVPYSTLFIGMYNLTSPQSGPAPGSGLFSFQPTGLFQISFDGLAKPLRFECEVGSTISFKVTKSIPKFGASVEYVAAMALPGKTGKYIVTDTPDLPQAGNVLMIFEAAAGTTATWGLSDCLVTERP